MQRILFNERLWVLVLLVRIAKPHGKRTLSLADGVETESGRRDFQHCSAGVNSLVRTASRTSKLSRSRLS